MCLLPAVCLGGGGEGGIEGFKPWVKREVGGLKGSNHGSSGRWGD